MNSQNDGPVGSNPHAQDIRCAMACIQRGFLWHKTEQGPVYWATVMQNLINLLTEAEKTEK